MVRRDLPPTQLAVQAIHAAVEAARNFLPADAEHPHLVLCAVDSEQQLLAAADRLFLGGIRHVLFREPDRANEVTALATEPLAAARRNALAHYRCLSRDDLLTAPGVTEGRAADPGERDVLSSC